MVLSMWLKKLRKTKGFKILTHKYVLVLLLFAIWMAFFDTNSFLIHWELCREIEKLEHQKEFLQGEIARDQDILKKLSYPEELEKLAREKYYMKRENEEIFLIEYEDSLQSSKQW